LAAWLTIDEKYKHIWAGSILENPVLNLRFNAIASDIEDWNYACAANEPFENHNKKELGPLLDKKSPSQYTDQIETPTLIFAGEEDKRVPFRQSHDFYRLLKQRNLKTEMFTFKAGHQLDLSFEAWTKATYITCDWLAKTRRTS